MSFFFRVSREGAVIYLHVGERREEERTTAKRVNGKHGRDGKDEVESAETDRGVQCLRGCGAALLEDGRRVEGHLVCVSHKVCGNGACAVKIGVDGTWGRCHVGQIM